MRAIINGMQRAGHAPFHTLTPQQARLGYQLGAQVLEVDMPANVAHREDVITARDGAFLPMRLYWTGNQPDEVQQRPTLLYLHGGGFTIGGIGTHDVLCGRMAANTGAMVVSLDYRLAPEYRFPTAVHDSWDALLWLANQGVGWGVDRSRLAVAGDSAGGTLAAVVALMARDAGLHLRAQCLIYPGTCAHQDTPSHARFARGPVLTEPLITWFFAQYIDRKDREDWRFAPLLAPTLEGAAPALLVLAECDPLVDEGVAYADRLRMERVPVALELYRGVAHEFLKMGRALPEAAQAHQAIADFLKAQLMV
ncbi:alpha/beta hydrolase [Lampropedia puyangensis]|uniref:Alpha/beta hydrolase n=2 Tax=Lampropedia puyangensis TaxID=1330072 RepID=A0A4V4GS55_9BURK|nr:alpha/beta hydrolase [Lampropedia puyangensis]